MKDHFSYSQLDVYDKCPKSYWARYLREGARRSLPSPQMEEGTKVHDEIEEQLTITAKTDKIPTCVRWVVEKEFKPNNMLAEVEFSLPFMQGDLIGRIDLLAHNAERGFLIDWKLNRIPDDDLQLKLYALYVAETYGVEHVSAWYVGVKSNMRRRHDYELSELLEYRREIQFRIDQLVTDKEHKIRPGGHCKNCPYLQECAVRHQYIVDRIETEEQAKMVLRHTLRTEAQYKHNRALLEDYLDREGLDEIEADNERFYLSPSVATRFGKVSSKKKKKP